MGFFYDAEQNTYAKQIKVWNSYENKKIYTRKVFKDFKMKLVNCTSYKIEDDIETVQNCYLVCHTNTRAQRYLGNNTNSKYM